MNLWEETNEVLDEHGYSWDDVEWIGCYDFEIPKEDCSKLFDKEYDSGWGCAEVAEDLLVVGKDFYMTRGEYDGSEWWEFHKMPARPNKVKKVRGVINRSSGWNDLESFTYKGRGKKKEEDK